MSKLIRPCTEDDFTEKHSGSGPSASTHDGSKRSFDMNPCVAGGEFVVKVSARRTAGLSSGRTGHPQEIVVVTEEVG